ncbi:DUF3710 domain-containing protein [Frankia sp. AgKG'84/4]
MGFGGRWFGPGHGRGDHGRDESAPAVDAAPARATARGPYDLVDLPGDGRRRVDLGSLVVPVPAGATIEVPAAAGGAPPGPLAVVRAGQVTVTLAVFAAPKSRGLWDEARARLAASPAAVLAAAGLPPAPAGSGLAGSGLAGSGLAGSGLAGSGLAGSGLAGSGLAGSGLAGSGPAARPVETVTGDFGGEVRLTLDPVADGGEATVVRVVGFDGRRWMLRAAVTAPVAAAAEADRLLAAVACETVVLRGTRAAPSGAPLPLRRPGDADDGRAGELLGGDPLAALIPGLGAEHGAGATDQVRRAVGARRRAATPAATAESEDGGRVGGDRTGQVDALHDEVDDQIGRVRPNGAIVLDTRGANRGVNTVYVAGMSQNLSTWG